MLTQLHAANDCNPFPRLRKHRVELELASWSLEDSEALAWRHGHQGGLAALREAIRAFLLASGRLDYIWTNYIEPHFDPLIDRVRALTMARQLRQISGRALFFLLTLGAAAPYTLNALSDCLDKIDGPLDETAHAALVADIIIDGLLGKN